MKSSLVLSAAIVLAAAIFSATARAQEQSGMAVSTSCALWLQHASAQGSAGHESEGREYIRGERYGYAIGVISAMDHELFIRFRRNQSHIKDANELITGIDALCASSPQKRLIDVTLHLLGVR